ncbi:MAG: pentapeptide repeat-containing protein [Methylococcaceae bacterium]|nr:MAG: pentapeptide repeat-containing protein [Methylococcaceae bacterium]
MDQTLVVTRKSTTRPCRWLAGLLLPLWLSGCGAGFKTSTDLSRGNFKNADFQGARLAGANLSAADFTAANFKEADLNNANLALARLQQAHFAGANLRHTNLRGANLADAELSGALFEGADLSGAVWWDGRRCAEPSIGFCKTAAQTADGCAQAPAQAVNWSGCDLRRRDLHGRDLQGADVSGADLRGADLHGANLRQAHMAGTRWDATTDFGNALWWDGRRCQETSKGDCR